MCNDRLSGSLLVLFGALVLWRASTFPSLAGLEYGPGLFPSIAAIGLIVCGALLLDLLGFHIASFMAVSATALIFGMRAGGAVLLALPLVIGVHLLFYSLLRVPLPWGLLTPMAW